ELIATRVHVRQRGTPVNHPPACPAAMRGSQFARCRSRRSRMSRLFGPMRQVGIVVRDIDKAMRQWVEVCGIGPWFYAEQLPLTEFRYKGRVYDIKMSVALANSG